MASDNSLMAYTTYHTTFNVFSVSLSLSSQSIKFNQVFTRLGPTKHEPDMTAPLQRIWPRLDMDNTCNNKCKEKQYGQLLLLS